MALTRATVERRLKSLNAKIAEAERVAKEHADRAEAAEGRAKVLTAERDWLAAAPVADPLPGIEEPQA